MKLIKHFAFTPALLLLATTSAVAQQQAAPQWRLPLRAAGAAAQRQLWGYMGSCRDWPTASAGYGFMAFTTGSTPTFTDLLADGEHTMSPNGGGALHDGRYDAVNYVQSNGTLRVTHYQFNTANNWRSTIVPTTVSDPTLIATETASSRATGKVYGQFYNSSLSGFEFGVIDYDAMERTTIGESQNKYVALGVTSYEALYGVATDGNLYRIDTETGEEHLVGPTGVEVAENSRQSYSQSGEIDQDNDVFYWASIDKNQHAALYTVDLTSGAATLIADMPHNEQILGMAIPDATPADAAPAAVADFDVAFSGGSTSGSATFTVPTKTYSGTALTGTVSYVVKANQRTVASGTATPGQRISAPVSVREGINYFRLSLSNEAGDAPVERLTRYVGYDEPLAPSSARLSVSANGTATATWGAPTRGVNGGYVGNLTYDVVRNPGNVTVVTGGTTLSFSEQLPDQLGNYTYSITAVNGNKRSEAARTNAVRHGSSIEPTYTETFGTQEDFNLYKVINANNDSYTWSWHEVLQCAQYEASPSASADDWLVSPAIHLQANHVYNLSFQARNSLVYYNEVIEAKWGTADNAAALTNTILGETTLSGAEFQTFTKEITSDRDQTIYIGIHALSSAGAAKILVDDITIEDEGHLQGPDGVQQLAITPDAQANLKATVAFTAPTKNVQGSAVGAITRIEVTRDGALVHTFTNVSAGQQLSCTDDAPRHGLNTYAVTGYTQQGVGRKVTYPVWVGLDQPAAPQAIKTSEANGKIGLSWTAPTGKGAHDGVVLADGLSYTVYEYDADDVLQPWMPVVEDLQETRYDLSLSTTGSQTVHRYALSARNDAGEGERASAPEVVSGAPYTLPFHAGFKPGVDPSLWWSPLTESSNVWVRNGQQAADGDGHCMMFTSYNAETPALLYSGKIALAGTQNAEVVFSHNATASSKDRIEVTLRQPGGEEETIGTVDYQTITGSGWQRSSFKIPAKYASAPYVVVGFRATAPIYHAIRLDDVCVRGVLAHDLSLAMTAPAQVEKGVPVEVSLTVENRGTQPVSAYSVQLAAGDEALYSEDFQETLQPLATRTINTRVVIPVSLSGSEQALTAQLVYDGDEDQANNTATQQLLLAESPVPAPVSVQGSQQGDAVSLSWTAPSPASIHTEETFDEYPAWTIDKIGQWTTYTDPAKTETGWMWGAMGMPFEHEGEPYAFIVFVPDSIQDGITYYNHTLKPHSGDRCLMARYSRDANRTLLDGNDWLFSPMLSGEAQTISFFANDTESDAMNPRYSASIEVLYSAKGTRPEDFVTVDGFNQDNGRWGFFSFDVPQGAQYFAIRNVSSADDFDGLLLDDIEYCAGYGLLEGFNVYRDGELIESLSADATSFTEPQMPWGRHQYAVTAVFAGGESALATNNALIFTGITATTATQEQADRQPVFSLSGQRVGIQADLPQLPKGVYLVGGKKVVVK